MVTFLLEYISNLCNQIFLFGEEVGLYSSRSSTVIAIIHFDVPVLICAVAKKINSNTLAWALLAIENYSFLKPLESPSEHPYT